jgi:hypothetical protein
VTVVERGLIASHTYRKYEINIIVKMFGICEMPLLWDKEQRRSAIVCVPGPSATIIPLDKCELFLGTILPWVRKFSGLQYLCLISGSWVLIKCHSDVYK